MFEYPFGNILVEHLHLDASRLNTWILVFNTHITHRQCRPCALPRPVPMPRPQIFLGSTILAEVVVDKLRFDTVGKEQCSFDTFVRNPSRLLCYLSDEVL